MKNQELNNSEDSNFENEDFDNELEEWEQELDERIEFETKKKKKLKAKKRKKNKYQLNGIESKQKFKPLEKLNNMETKSNVSNSLIKTVVDTIACLFIAPALSAVSGKYAPLLGGAINFSGHYVDDKSGLLRAIGVGTMVYGMANVNEYRSEDSTIKSRFGGVNDNWLKFFLNKEPESKKNELINSETKSSELSENENQVSGIPLEDTSKIIDFSSLKDHTNYFEDSSSSSFGINQETKKEIDDFDVNPRYYDDDIDFTLL